MATRSGGDEDGAVGTRRHGSDKTVQPGRWERQGQKRVRRLRCSVVYKHAGSFLQRLGSGVLVDAGPVAGERGCGCERKNERSGAASMARRETMRGLLCHCQ